MPLYAPACSEAILIVSTPSWRGALPPSLTPCAVVAGSAAPEEAKGTAPCPRHLTAPKKTTTNRRINFGLIKYLHCQERERRSNLRARHLAHGAADGSLDRCVDSRPGRREPHRESQHDRHGTPAWPGPLPRAVALPRGRADVFSHSRTPRNAQEDCTAGGRHCNTQPR